MKEYKLGKNKSFLVKNNNIYSFLTHRKTCYKINNNLHGLYIVFSNERKYYFFKGYYNMGIECSHWLEYDIYFKYFL